MQRVMMGFFAMERRSFLSPALVLFFLSPVIGELLSGSAPPAEFFNPLGFVMLAVLYGGGALLVRELTHRWHKGWATLLVLGAVYGIAEEGLMCKSFFDPNWMDLGPLASYGRWVGVNWVWAVELTVYHTVFSVVIPILLAGIVFPAQRQRHWISLRTFVILLIAWVANAVLIFSFISPYRPLALHYLMTMMVAAGLCLLAWRLPHPRLVSDTKRKKPGHWSGFLLTGFLGTLALFFLAWVSPHTGINAAATIVLMLGLVTLVGWVVLRSSGAGLNWSDKHKLALASGALGFFVLLAPLQEFDKNRNDNTTGMTIVGLAAAAFLIWIALHIKRAKEVALE